MEENGCGKFADVNEAALASLKALGVTHIWLTGVLRQATLTDYSEFGMPADDPDIVKGRAGSFYAVKDYFDVCPDYALNVQHRLVEFRELVARVHSAGMKVLIDFVPNHVARSYDSLVRPDLNFGDGDDQTKFFDPANHFYYLAEPAGQHLTLSKPASWNPVGVVFDGAFAQEDGTPGHTPRVTGSGNCSPNPGVDDWYEVVKLNYGWNFVDGTEQYDPIPRTWTVMDEVLCYWQEFGVDGFRCDMAHLVPAAAWKHLIDNARFREPEVFFMAEAYFYDGSPGPVMRREDLLATGFDAIYFDASHHTLSGIRCGIRNQEDYDAVLHELSEEARDRAAQYLENHDEVRVAGPIAGSPPDGFGSYLANYQLAPLQFLYSRGPVLVYNGQEVGEPGGGDCGYHHSTNRSTFFDYWGMPEFAKWVNGGAYDGGELSEEQRRLRAYFGDLLALVQDSAVTGGNFWGLKYFNRPDRFWDCPADLFSFARYKPGSGHLLLVIANFRPGGASRGLIRLPAELAIAAGLSGEVKGTLVLDENGKQATALFAYPADQLTRRGVLVEVRDQACIVISVNS